AHGYYERMRTNGDSPDSTVRDVSPDGPGTSNNAAEVGQSRLPATASMSTQPLHSIPRERHVSSSVCPSEMSSGNLQSNFSVASTSLPGTPSRMDYGESVGSLQSILEGMEAGPSNAANIIHAEMYPNNQHPMMVSRYYNNQPIMQQ
ncbi:hypothetical protein PFISCL1PPCAC_28033, partial [Pristionchus fissidentatus]